MSPPLSHFYKWGTATADPLISETSYAGIGSRVQPWTLDTSTERHAWVLPWSGGVHVTSLDILEAFRVLSVCGRCTVNHISGLSQSQNWSCCFENILKNWEILFRCEQNSKKSLKLKSKRLPWYWNLKAIYDFVSFSHIYMYSFTIWLIFYFYKYLILPPGMPLALSCTACRGHLSTSTCKDNPFLFTSVLTVLSSDGSYQVEGLEGQGASGWSVPDHLSGLQALT